MDLHSDHIFLSGIESLRIRILGRTGMPAYGSFCLQASPEETVNNPGRFNILPQLVLQLMDLFLQRHSDRQWPYSRSSCLMQMDGVVSEVNVFEGC